MKRVLLTGTAIASMIVGLAFAAESRMPTDEEIRTKQVLGRALIAPNGQFFVYEWMRPYNWVRDTGSVHSAAANRMQTWLYRASATDSPPSAEYLFFPDMHASYWLGAFSPSGDKISFYELDNDDNILKAGVVFLGGADAAPKLTRFESAPDASKLDQPPIWITNDELVYSTGGKKAARLRANALTGETKSCDQDCTALLAKVKPPAQEKPKASKLPAGTRLLAQSGDLALYEKIDPKTLSLTFKKGANASEAIVFENERHPISWSPPKWPSQKDTDAATSASVAPTPK